MTLYNDMSRYLRVENGIFRLKFLRAHRLDDY